MLNSKCVSTAIVLSFFVTVVATSAMFAQNGLKTINNPQGGNISYGQVANQTNEAGAMGAILRNLHQQFGDKPQVGKLFQVRGTQSVAAFFTVNKHTQGKGQAAGMIIVTKVTSDRVEAGIISDDASHFGTTLQPMLKTLFGAWHPFQGVSTAGSASAIPPMHQFVTQDRSASVDLPDGWKPSPGSTGGTIFAEGPNGEVAFLGLTYLAMDTNNPQVQKTMRIVQQGGLRNTTYANGLYYPYGADLGKTFVDMTQWTRQKNGQAAAAIQIAKEERAPSPPNEQCAHLTGQIDPKDGKGAREMNTIFCVSAPARFGSYLGSAYHTAVPDAFADKERATMGAILASFQVDMAVVQREAHAYAAPAIDAIHAIGKAAAAQAAAAHERNDIQNSSVYQHWDSMDRRSQEFENYQLGYSVVHDMSTDTHATLWNEDANFLVQHDPDRFEYVNSPDFWKGVDY
jgi:hypothetical protein